MPKVTIFLKEVPGIVPKCSICGICESSRALHSIEPLVNASQLFISLAGSVRMQEGVIGQQGYGDRVSEKIFLPYKGRHLICALYHPYNILYGEPPGQQHPIRIGLTLYGSVNALQSSPTF